jgi:hypothetical protein
MRESELRLDGKPLRADAAFLRYDVFDHLADGRPATEHAAGAWFATLHGYCLSREDMRVFNKEMSAVASSKLATLHLAAELGL